MITLTDLYAPTGSAVTNYTDLVLSQYAIIQKEIENQKLNEQYEKLFNAACKVESNFNRFAHNPKEEAYGIVQIRQIRLDDYYKKTGKRYTLTDCYDVGVSKEIYLYYCTHENNSIEMKAKRWNGSGPMTEDYWSEIQKYL
jgi:hypothetical protein